MALISGQLQRSGILTQKISPTVNVIAWPLSNLDMTTRSVIVPWQKGLHLRAATKLVNLANSFRSTIRIHYQGQVANLRSIVSVIGLCAVMGSPLLIEVTGDDEVEAVQAVMQVFAGGEEVG